LLTIDADRGGGFGRRIRYLPRGMPEKLAELVGAAHGPARDGLVGELIASLVTAGWSERDAREANLICAGG
jgi:hypothetical protein